MANNWARPEKSKNTASQTKEVLSFLNWINPNKPPSTANESRM